MKMGRLQVARRRLYSWANPSEKPRNEITDGGKNCGDAGAAYESALFSTFFGVTLASVVLIHFRVRASWQDAWGVLCGAVLFAVIDVTFLHFTPSLAGTASFLGISSLSILGLRAIWSRGKEQERVALAFVPALLFVTSGLRQHDLARMDGEGQPESSQSLFVFV